MTKLSLGQQVHKVACKLLDAGITESQIADAADVSRQALNQRQIRAPGKDTMSSLGFGLGVIRSAWQNGFLSDALTLLNGETFELSSGSAALL